MSEVKTVVFKISTTPIESFSGPITPTPVLRCGEQPPDGGDLYVSLTRRRRRAQQLARKVLYGLKKCEQPQKNDG